MSELRYVSATDIGLVRDENQDMVRVDDFYGRVLAVVCDGMGGERAGQDASRIAIKEFFNRFAEGLEPNLDTIGVRQLMTASVSAANSVIYTTARMNYRSFGMGTTLVAAYIDDRYIYIVNIGDSRAYYMDDEGLHQITSDHTFVNMLLQQGKIEPDERREDALKREIREELAAEITIERYLEKVEWDYPKFRLTMYCYLCKLDSGYTLKEHSAAKWLKRNERLTVDWLPADRALFMKTTF